MNSQTVQAAGGFWALSGDGRRYRVTAYRVVKRSPNGRHVQAYTRLSLGGGHEVRRVRAGVYRVDRLGALLRESWAGPVSA